MAREALPAIRPMPTRSLVLLFCAIAFEVTWAVMLKLSHGFQSLLPSAIMLATYVASLVSLTLACAKLELAVAYSVWTGAGASFVALVGLFVFDEPVSGGRTLGLALVILGVVLLLAFERPRASS